jgi:hypothetical protein
MTENVHDLISKLWSPDQKIDHHVSRYREIAAMAEVTDLLTSDHPTPKHYNAAVCRSNPDRSSWIQSIDKEITTLESKGTWVMVPRSKMYKARKKPVRTKFVFRKKLLKDGSIQFKSRLVACGYSQIAGIDYSADELYASVCSYSSMRFLLSLATQKNYLLYQTDIQGAYLESELHDEIYMEPPPTMFDKNGKPPCDPRSGEPLVCQIKKGIYGLKQSGYAWAHTFKDFMLSDPEYDMGFSQMTGEANLYHKKWMLNGQLSEVYVGQYVDDCLVVASSEEAKCWVNKVDTQ